jgi:Xaa-Pro aminopeptidase
MLVNTKRLVQMLDTELLDGLVVTTQENVHYMTGILSVSLTLFPHDGQCYAVIDRDQPDKPFFISSVGEMDQILDGFGNLRGTMTFGKFFRELPEGAVLTGSESQLFNATIHQHAITPLDAIVDTLKALGIHNKRVGIDELGLRSGYFEALKERLPDAEFVKASSMIRWVRCVKTEEEIRRLSAAVRVTEQAILASVAIAREGITEQEMAREFERSLASQGALPRLTCLRFGRNGVGGQVLPDRTPLRQGDTIWFDVGCLYNGYWSDIARVFALGEPCERAIHIYNAMLAGEEHAIQATRAGMTGGELFDLIMETTRQAGVPHYQRHHVGHGIGAEMYEAPVIGPGVDIVIEDGMVLNVETPYYEYGLGALHVEDPFVVRQNGNQLLTSLCRELRIID